MKKTILPLLALSLAFFIQSCKKDTASYDIPTTYNFTGADFSASTTRLAMISALVSEIKKGNVSGTPVNAQLLKNMFSNTGSPFTNDTLNTSGLQLKDQTALADQSAIETIFDNAAAANQANATAADGTAGFLTGGTKSYLVDANGREYKEATEKALQGALIYYQITAVCLSESKVGEQVAMAERQHNWDAAFGYFGIPIDYPTNTAGTQQVGKYANDRNTLVGNATAVMNAFLKGRAAINHGDNETVTAQIQIIRENIEKGIAATTVHYINASLANVSDAPTYHHNMSEGYYLVNSLKYNPVKKISDTQIQTLLSYFGSSFYATNLADLQSAKDLLSSIYGLDAVKDQL